MEDAHDHAVRFVDSGATRDTLGLVYGRRRIGKSTLLSALAAERAGFYWEATRTESTVQRARLAAALGAHLGVGRLALETWEDGFESLLRLGEQTAVPIVLDGFGHVIEADPSVPSIVASALGPAGRHRSRGQARLILCGSAIAMMRALTGGQAALRGRAGMELVMQPDDFRQARFRMLPHRDEHLATRLYAVIGGVIGYATDMVDHDLPADRADFDRWVCARVLSPAATLHHEAATLLAEDPTLSTASPLLHHAILGAIANGSVTAGTIAKRLARRVSNLDPALKRLVAAGFLHRHEDPIRAQRPTYSLADPFLQFHYAVLEPHGPLLRERDPLAVWQGRLSATFDSLVRGPVFEEQARTWVRRYASAETLGGIPDHVGPSAVTIERVERQIDVVAAVAAPGDEIPANRDVLALGEAKAGETVGPGRLDVLERARASLGARAAGAKLLLFAPAFEERLALLARTRSDVELIDLERLYSGT